MKLNFNIDYRTNWGESLYISGHTPRLGDGDESRAVKMEQSGPSTWILEVDLPDDAGAFDYSYIVRHENGGHRHRRWQALRRCPP